MRALFAAALFVIASLDSPMAQADAPRFQYNEVTTSTFCNLMIVRTRIRFNLSYLETGLDQYFFYAGEVGAGEASYEQSTKVCSILVL